MQNSRFTANLFQVRKKGRYSKMTRPWFFFVRFEIRIPWASVNNQHKKKTIVSVLRVAVDVIKCLKEIKLPGSLYASAG